jgi:hypothetical protein
MAAPQFEIWTSPYGGVTTGYRAKAGAVEIKITGIK